MTAGRVLDDLRPAALGAASGLAMASVLACHLPARYATSVDPAIAFRSN